MLRAFLVGFYPDGYNKEYNLKDLRKMIKEGCFFVSR